MTPFDPNLPPNAEQPLGPHSVDQDDLIAFHLNELPRSQVRAVHRALRNNPHLQAESIAIAATLRTFPKHEAALPLDAAALDRHWQTLLPSLTPHIPAPVVPTNFFPNTLFSSWTLPTLAGSALVAAALFVAFHLTHQPQSPTTATIATSSSTIPTPTSPASSQPMRPTAPLAHVPPNEFDSSLHTIHRRWPISSAPFETATANPPTPVFPTQAPTDVASANPISTSSGITSANSATALPLTTFQIHPPAQSSTQPAIQPGRSLRTSTPRRSPTTELTLAVFADITAYRSSTYTTGSGTSLVSESLSQIATPAVGALASFRQQFSPWRGYRVAVTYTRPSFIDTYKPSNSSNAQGTDGDLNINHKIYEFSGTYVAQGPHRGRLSTSAEAGAALLSFSSSDTYDYPVTNTHSFRPAAVVGVGTELALTKHWGLRAEYRALFYKPPAFNSAVDESVPVGSLTLSSNPLVGITYRFGPNGSD